MEDATQDSAPSSSASAASDAEWVAIGTEAELRQKGRMTVVISDRKVTVFYRDGEMYVLDFHCYHAGGPLDVGNIEDINGISCIVCPWHRIKISLSTGEGFYQSIDPKNPKEPPCWRSKGVKQRTHRARLMDGSVYVMLSTSPTKYASDHYYTQDYRRRMDVNYDS